MPFKNQTKRWEYRYNQINQIVLTSSVFSGAWLTQRDFQRFHHHNETTCQQGGTTCNPKPQENSGWRIRLREAHCPNSVSILTVASQWITVRARVSISMLLEMSLVRWMLVMPIISFQASVVFSFDAFEDCDGSFTSLLLCLLSWRLALRLRDVLGGISSLQ